MTPSQGAAAAIVGSHGPLLLVNENYDRRRYSLPVGAVEHGEPDRRCRSRDIVADRRGVVRDRLPRIN